MRTLFEAPSESAPRTMMEGGISPSLDAEVGALWYDGENIVFRDGGPRTSPGHDRLCFPLYGEVNCLAQAYIGSRGTQRLFMGTAEYLLCWQSSVGQVILGENFNGGDWSFTVWGNWLVAVNGIDALQIWRNNFSAGTEEVADIPFSWARIVRRMAAHVVVFHTNHNPAQIAWCSADDIDNWGLFEGVYYADPAKTAGEITLRDLESEIVAAEPLGEAMGVYTFDSMLLMQYVGQPEIFGVQRVSGNIGAVSKNSVIPVGVYNFGLGRQGVWRTDGVQTEYVDEPAMRQWMQENINWLFMDRIVGFHDEHENMVVWFVPTGDSEVNDNGIGFNYKTGAWTRFSYGMTAAQERMVFSHPIVADSVGVYLQGIGTVKGIEPLQSWIQSQPLDMGDPFTYKRVQALVLGLEGTDINIRLGSQDTRGNAIEWFYYGPASRNVHIPDRETALLTVKLESAGEPWELVSLRVLGEPTGFVI